MTTDINAVLDELTASVAPGAADRQLVAYNAKLREEGASYNLRIAELELKLRNAEAALREAERAEADALSRLVYAEAKIAEKDRVIAGMSKAYGNVSRKTLGIKETARDETIRAASATSRALDAERKVEVLTQNATKLLARVEVAEPRARAAEAAEEAAAKATEAEGRAYIWAHYAQNEVLRDIVEAADRSSPKYAIDEARKKLSSGSITEVREMIESLHR